MKPERRKYTRYRAKKDAYAALGIDFTKVGKLKDISIAGLAFEYIDCTENCVKDSSRIAIFNSNNNFHLPNLGCCLICNSTIVSENATAEFNRQYVIHRCGIQFGNLTAKQREKLEYFIRNYTRGTVAPVPLDQS